jgi:hypothetical protein
MSNISYKVSMLGVSLADPYAFLKAVFPQWNGEPAQSGGAYVIVTFDSPQTPADLGPLVRVEIYDPSQPRLP